LAQESLKKNNFSANTKDLHFMTMVQAGLPPGSKLNNGVAIKIFNRVKT
jgi:hypothetical protein